MTNSAQAATARTRSGPVTPEEFDDFYRVAMHAFHGSPLSEGDRELSLAALEFDRSLAAFDDKKWSAPRPSTPTS